jgi:hypothetical protein
LTLPVRLRNADPFVVSAPTDIVFELGKPLSEVIPRDAQAGPGAAKPRETRTLAVRRQIRYDSAGRPKGGSIMKSPFPGMDPYLEQHWGDVHHNLITFAQGLLNDHLPRDLRARVEERVLVDPDRKPLRPSWEHHWMGPGPLLPLSPAVWPVKSHYQAPLCRCC